MVKNLRLTNMIFTVECDEETSFSVILRTWWLNRDGEAFLGRVKSPLTLPICVQTCVTYTAPRLVIEKEQNFNYNSLLEHRTLLSNYF